MYMPQIIETTGRTKKSFDIVSKLYENNAIMLFEEIDDETSFKIITQLLYLDSIDTDEHIKIYVNSPGGLVTAGLAIIDTIQSLKRKVDIIGIGQCASMGATILACGTGERKALKNTRIMLHAISGGFVGNYHDHKINFKEEEYLHNKLIEILAKRSNNTKEKIQELTKRDYFMSPEEAIKLGFLDSVI